MSFGQLTLPHQLMKLVLMEQIYRAFMIQQGVLTINNLDAPSFSAKMK